MPAKKETLTDAERAKRIRELAREAETDNDPESFERAFEKIIKVASVARKRTAGTRKS
jgi:Asp-tRNA(Asn)/Glu-tRNA(Gln) amidotransferase C subunit